MLRTPALPRLGARAALLAAAFAIALPAAAQGHGGTTIADGQRDGVTVRVQGSDSTTPSGQPAADLATTLAGPRTGEGASVIYWVRPEGGDTFKVATERDEGGVHHAEIATAGRGDWRTWEVSAITTLTTGAQLRVTNAEGSPPGPDPQQPRARGGERPAADEAAATTSPDASTPATSPAEAEPAPPVDDISGESDGAPGWVIPSVLIVALLGLGGLVLARRSRPAADDDADEDWDARG